MARNYKVIDVFTSVPFLGNPVAVVFEAADMDQSEPLGRRR